MTNLLSSAILLALGMGLAPPAIAADATPTPIPAATAAPDPCGAPHTDLLAAINRPTVGFSACSVKPRDVLAEIGYANERLASGDATATYPQSFIRFGLAPKWEADIVGPVYATQRSGGITTSGSLDSGFGFKYQFFNASGTQAAIDGLYTAPNGSSAFTAGKPTYTLNLDVGHSLSSRVSAAATLAFVSTSAQDRNGNNAHYNALLPSAVLVEQLSSGTQLYAEAYGATRIRPDGGSRFALDAGVQTLLTRKVEFDVEIGRTVTDIDRSHYAGFGFGLRL